MIDDGATPSHACVLMCKTRAETETRLQVRTDDLTGLANRRALDEAKAQAFARAGRSCGPARAR